jgi:hypothetical protein
VPHHRSATPAKLVELVREATRQFINVKAATTAGYRRFLGCVGGPDHGDIGVHYLKGALVGDGEIDASRPEAQICELAADGFRLLGVEFIVNSATCLARHGVRRCSRPSVAVSSEAPLVFAGQKAGTQPGRRRERRMCKLAHFKASEPVMRANLPGYGPMEQRSQRVASPCVTSILVPGIDDDVTNQAFSICNLNHLRAQAPNTPNPACYPRIRGGSPPDLARPGRSAMHDTPVRAEVSLPAVAHNPTTNDVLTKRKTKPFSSASAGPPAEARTAVQRKSQSKGSFGYETEDTGTNRKMRSHSAGILGVFMARPAFLQRVGGRREKKKARSHFSAPLPSSPPAYFLRQYLTLSHNGSTI